MIVKTQKVVLVVISALILSFVSTGCLSQKVYDGSRQRVAMRKAGEIRDVEKRDRAIRAVRLGDNGAGIGLDITNLEALKERWPLHLLLDCFHEK